MRLRKKQKAINQRFSWETKSSKTKNQRLTVQNVEIKYYLIVLSLKLQLNSALFCFKLENSLIWVIPKVQTIVSFWREIRALKVLLSLKWISGVQLGQVEMICNKLLRKFSILHMSHFHMRLRKLKILSF